MIRENQPGLTNEKAMEAANEDIPGIDIAGVLKSSRAVSKVSITVQTEGESTLTVHAEMDNLEAGPVQSASITTSTEQEWPTYQATTYLGKRYGAKGKTVAFR